MKKKSLILGRNILINFLSQFLIFAIIFFTTPFILQNLGKTDYSLLIFLTTIVGFFIALDFGFSPAFVQAFSQKRGRGEDQTELFWTSLLFYLCLSAFWALLIFVLAPILLMKFFPIVKQVGSLSIVLLRVFSLVLFLSNMSNFFTLSFQALQKFHLANLRPILLGIIIPVGSVYLLKTGKALNEIVYLHLFAHLAVAVFLFSLLLRNLVLKKTAVWSGQTLREMFSFAKWKFIGQLAGQIKQKSSRFFLSFHLPIDNLAFFVIPQNLTIRYISLLPNITAPVFTMTAELTGQEGKEALLKLYRYSVKLINLFLLPIGAFLFFNGQDFLSLWIGMEFAQRAGLILQILVLAYSLAILNGLPTVFLEGKGQPSLPARMSILIVSLFFVFLFFLVPSLGLLGAALASFLSYLVQVPLFLIMATKRILGKLDFRFFLTSYLSPIFLALVAALILDFFKGKVENWLVFLLNFSLFFMIYFFLVVIFKLVGKEERELLQRLCKFLRSS